MVGACSTAMVLLAVSGALWPEALAFDSNESTTTATSSFTQTSTTSEHSTTATSTSEHSTTATSSITQTRGFACLGVQDAFDAGRGPCHEYHPTVEYDGDYNFYYCDVDLDNATGFSAAQVCPQCVLCSAECLGDAFTFDAGYGNCSSYAEELDYNWGYCVEDYDNASGLFAFQACPECQSCDLPATDDFSSTTEAYTTEAPATSHAPANGASTQQLASTASPGASTMAPATTTEPAATGSATATQASVDEASAGRAGSGVEAEFAFLLFFLVAANARP